MSGAEQVPDWVVGLVVQLPLVSAVTWAFLTGKVHSDAELRRVQDDHQAELKRRTDTLGTQVADWKRLYEQERADRVEANQRLSTAAETIRQVMNNVEDLTREMIRNGPR